MSLSSHSTTEPNPGLPDVLLSLLRAVVGFLFICHGASKLFGVLGGALGSGKPAVLASLIGVSGVIEFVGGFLLLGGLFTRPTAFIMSGEMAVAYIHTHVPRGPWPLTNRGELALVYCFLLLYLAFAGGGAYGLDRLLGARMRRARSARSPDLPPHQAHNAGRT